MLQSFVSVQRMVDMTLTYVRDNHSLIKNKNNTNFSEESYPIGINYEEKSQQLEIPLSTNCQVFNITSAYFLFLLDSELKTKI